MSSTFDGLSLTNSRDIKCNSIFLSYNNEIKDIKDIFSFKSDISSITGLTPKTLNALQELANAGETFDLVFIDADKKEYVDYFNLLLDKGLLAENGFICVDNTLLQGQPYLVSAKRTTNGEAIAQFNQIVAADPRVEQVILPLRDGLTIIKRK